MDITKTRAAKRSRWIALPLLLAAAMTGCGGDGSPAAPDEPGEPGDPTANVASVELDIQAGKLAKGQSYGLDVTAKDPAGEVVTGFRATFTTSNPSILSVAEDGAVTATGAGSAEITVVVGDQAATASFTVVEFSAIAAGQYSTCAITTDGALYCAGFLHRDLGRLARTFAPELRFSEVHLGQYSACGLTTEGATYCWGDNRNGQLGTGDLERRDSPVEVAGGLRFTSLTLSPANTACGLTAEGNAYCWGTNDVGQLGDGTREGRLVPVAVAGGIRFMAIGAGGRVSCGVADGGAGYCWGAHDVGGLGIGPPAEGGAHRTVPTPVAGDLAFRQIIPPCGLTTEGGVYCWGNNRVGGVGAATTEICSGDHECSTVPVAVMEGQQGRAFTWIETETEARCAITEEHRAWCWGLNLGGKLGPNGPSACPGVATGGWGCTSTPFAAFPGFVSLAGGERHQCGLKTDGIAYCWGTNEQGQTTGATRGSTPTPHVFAIDPRAG